jgi:hypothetical protein
MTQLAAQVFRDYETDGDSSSGAHKVVKSDVRTWGAYVESGIIRPARLVTSSADLAVDKASDYAIALLRASSPAAMNIILDPASAVGQEYVIQDVFGNLFTYPALVAASGQTLNNASTFKMAQDFMTARFRYYGSNVWSVEVS